MPKYWIDLSAYNMELLVIGQSPDRRLALVPADRQQPMRWPESAKGNSQDQSADLLTFLPDGEAFVSEEPLTAALLRRDLWMARFPDAVFREGATLLRDVTAPNMAAALALPGQNFKGSPSLRKVPVALRPFLSQAQIRATEYGLQGEEGDFFTERMTSLTALVNAMPVAYETDGQGDQAIVHLHYFLRNADWYLTEKDSDPDGSGQVQAFGLTDLGHGFPEMGYINLQEIIRLGAEMDYHFTPLSLLDLKREKYPELIQDVPDEPETLLGLKEIATIGDTYQRAVQEINQDGGWDAIQNSVALHDRQQDALDHIIQARAQSVGGMLIDHGWERSGASFQRPDLQGVRIMGNGTTSRSGGNLVKWGYQLTVDHGKERRAETNIPDSFREEAETFARRLIQNAVEMAARVDNDLSDDRLVSADRIREAREALNQAITDGLSLGDLAIDLRAMGINAVMSSDDINQFFHMPVPADTMLLADVDNRTEDTTVVIRLPGTSGIVAWNADLDAYLQAEMSHPEEEYDPAQGFDQDASNTPSLEVNVSGDVPKAINVQVLNDLFRNDAAFGVRSVESDQGGGRSLFPDGTSALICTNYALQVKRILSNHDVQVVGFFATDNPDCAVSSEGWEEGHDFAIVDRRYLVDPWARLVEGVRERIVYDMSDDDDARLVAETYGDPLIWASATESDSQWDRRGTEKVMAHLHEMATDTVSQEAPERPVASRGDYVRYRNEIGNEVEGVVLDAAQPGESTRLRRIYRWPNGTPGISGEDHIASTLLLDNLVKHIPGAVTPGPDMDAVDPITEAYRRTMGMDDSRAQSERAILVAVETALGHLAQTEKDDEKHTNIEVNPFPPPSQYFVFEDTTLGFMRHDEMPGYFTPLAGERDWRNGGFHLLDEEISMLRPATKDDFEAFRVTLPPDFQESSAEVSQASDDQVTMDPDLMAHLRERASIRDGSHPNWSGLSDSVANAQEFVRQHAMRNPEVAEKWAADLRGNPFEYGEALGLESDNIRGIATQMEQAVHRIKHPQLSDLVRFKPHADRRGDPFSGRVMALQETSSGDVRYHLRAETGPDQGMEGTVYGRDGTFSLISIMEAYGFEHNAPKAEKAPQIQAGEDHRPVYLRKEQALQEYQAFYAQLPQREEKLVMEVRERSGRLAPTDFRGFSDMMRDFSKGVDDTFGIIREGENRGSSVPELRLAQAFAPEEISDLPAVKTARDQARRLGERFRDLDREIRDTFKARLREHGKALLKSGTLREPREIAQATYWKHGIEATPDSPMIGKITDAIRDKDLKTMMGMIGHNSLNPASGEVFSRITGIKMGKTQSARVAQLLEWAGPEKAQALRESNALAEREREARGLRNGMVSAWADLKGLRVDVGGQVVNGQEYVTLKVAGGKDRIASGKEGAATTYRLVNDRGDNSSVKDVRFTAFAKRVLAMDADGMVRNAMEKAGIVQGIAPEKVAQKPAADLQKEQNSSTTKPLSDPIVIDGKPIETREFLEERFGSDAAFGVRYVDESTGMDIPAEDLSSFEGDVISTFSDGGITNCTNYARYIQKALPLGAVQVVGFANGENSDSDAVREGWHPGGHDFAIVDHRYLVDPWAKLVAGVRNRIAYDLHDDQDAALVAQTYGGPATWSEIPEATNRPRTYEWDRTGLEKVLANRNARRVALRDAGRSAPQEEAQETSRAERAPNASSAKDRRADAGRFIPFSKKDLAQGRLTKISEDLLEVFQYIRREQRWNGDISDNVSDSVKKIRRDDILGKRESRLQWLKQNDHDVAQTVLVNALYRLIPASAASLPFMRLQGRGRTAPNDVALRAMGYIAVTEAIGERLDNLPVEMTQKHWKSWLLNPYLNYMMKPGTMIESGDGPVEADKPMSSVRLIVDNPLNYSKTAGEEIARSGLDGIREMLSTWRGLTPGALVNKSGLNGKGKLDPDDLLYAVMVELTENPAPNVPPIWERVTGYHPHNTAKSVEPLAVELKSRFDTKDNPQTDHYWNNMAGILVAPMLYRHARNRLLFDIAEKPEILDYFLETRLMPVLGNAGYTPEVRSTNQGAPESSEADRQDNGEAWGSRKKTPDAPYGEITRTIAPDVIDPSPRNGRDITDEEFVQDTGFSVQYGNYVNNKERQALLNMAYDGLHDMAAVLDVPVSSLAVRKNGVPLALALGARGSGRAMAHYEPGMDTHVINLTKTNGAGGAMIHEWLHAVDASMGATNNEMAKGLRLGGSFVSHKSGNALYNFVQGCKKPIEAAATIESLESKAVRLADLWRDRLLGKWLTPKLQTSFVARIEEYLKPYHANPEEKAKLGDKSAADYLPLIQQRLDDIAQTTASGIVSGNSKRALTAFNDAVQFWSNAGGRTWTYDEGALENNKAAFMKLDPALNDTQARVVGYAFAERFLSVARSEFKAVQRYASECHSLSLQTDFYSEAVMMDAGRKTPYWSSPHELLARAGSAAFYDKSREMGIHNDFLDAYSAPEIFSGPEFKGDPNPEGRERETLLAYFKQQVIPALQTFLLENAQEAEPEQREQRRMVANGDLSL